MSNKGPTKVKFDSPIKPINKWNSSAVKYALDDTVKKIVKEELEYVENFKLMDQRLAICTIACAFSGFALVYDYFINPFPASRPVLAVCAVCYFVMMGVLTLFTIYREGTTMMVALEKDEAGVEPDNVWTYQSSLPKFSDKYTLKVTFKDGQSAETRSVEIQKSVSCWFDEDGKICNTLFMTDVMNLHKDIGRTKKDL